ncbi:MAG: hypothetical protein ED557_14935 [Balneola sp.]|nr:MAG: hypothetical protein ED557_14935 [Balneola sp.]
MKKFTLKKKDKKEYRGPIPPVAEMNEETWELLKRRLWEDFANKLFRIVGVALTLFTVISILGFNFYIENLVENKVEPQVQTAIDTFDTLNTSLSQKSLETYLISNLLLSTQEDFDDISDLHVKAIDAYMLSEFNYLDIRSLKEDAYINNGIFSSEEERQKYISLLYLSSPQNCRLPISNRTIRMIISITFPDSVNYKYSTGTLSENEWRLFNSNNSDATHLRYSFYRCAYLSSLDYVQSSLYLNLFRELDDPSLEKQIHSFYEKNVANIFEEQIRETLYDSTALQKYQYQIVPFGRRRNLEGLEYLEAFRKKD